MRAVADSCSSVSLKSTFHVRVLAILVHYIIYYDFEGTGADCMSSASQRTLLTSLSVLQTLGSCMHIYLYI